MASSNQPSPRSATSVPQPRQARVLRSPRRLLMAAAGVVCVGLAGLGAVLPGLPTTVFLIAASYLFTRSCPYLEERLLRNDLFRPYLRYVDGSEPMPRRARVAAAALMWTSVLASTWILASRLEPGSWIPWLLPAAAVAGTWFIARWEGAGGSSSLQTPVGGEAARGG